MELAALVSESNLASAERAKVLASLGGHIPAELVIGQTIATRKHRGSNVNKQTILFDELQLDQLSSTDGVLLK